MRLLCDEDTGTGVPKALYLVGHDAISQVEVGWAGHPDVEWLARVGPLGWIVFSCNKRMLLDTKERATIIHAKVGIFFLTTGEEHKPKVLKMLLTRWDTLQTINHDTPRPYAFFLSPSGRISATYKKFSL